MDIYDEKEFEEKPMRLNNSNYLKDKEQKNEPYEAVFSAENFKYDEEEYEITKEDDENRYFINVNKITNKPENNQPITKSTSSITNINLIKKEKIENSNTPLNSNDYPRNKRQEKDGNDEAVSTSKVIYLEDCEMTEKGNKESITKTSPVIEIDSANGDQNTNEAPETNSNKINNPKDKNSSKIFGISKFNKKVGRMPKKLKNKFKAPHNKYSEDNIIRKDKARVQDIFMDFINYRYYKHLESKGISRKIKLLQRINPEESRKISKADNLRWFSTKLKDLFSSNLSGKCTLYDSDYNRRKINELYKNNEAIDVINILEKKVIDMYNLYRNNVKIEGFITLEEDLKQMREKMEKEKEKEKEEEEEDIELYLSNYKDIALRLDKIFEDKVGRKKKSKKISL